MLGTCTTAWRKWKFVYGVPPIGMARICCWTLNSYYIHEVRIKFITFYRIKNALSRSSNSTSSSRNHQIDRHAMCPFLVGSIQTGGSKRAKFDNNVQVYQGRRWGTTCAFLIAEDEAKKEKEEMVRDQASRKNQSMMTGGLLLLFGRVSVDSENLLIMIVEAGQKLEGPSRCCLHRVRALIVGRWHAADADADAPDATATTGTPIINANGVTTSVIKAVTTTAGDSDDAAEPVADLLPLRRYFLPL